MNQQTLDRLNRRLGDVRGYNPHGQPLFAWIHSSLLFYPVNMGGGSYCQQRQIDEDRWLVAKWDAPMPERQWKAQFPDIGYPANGMYYATDQILVEGTEPNEAINEDVAHRLKVNASKTFKDHLNDIERAREVQELANKNYISDFVDDACVAFNNIPGKRGGATSFGGIDTAPTPKEA